MQNSSSSKAQIVLNSQLATDHLKILNQASPLIKNAVEDVDFSQKATYTITLKTGKDSKYSGTDSWVMLTMFGPNGNSNEVRLDDTSSSDDFEKNEKNVMKFTSAQGDIGSNIGSPYAIHLNLPKNRDAWQLLWIEIEYKSGSTIKKTKFSYNGWFGKAGYKTIGSKDRWAASIFADGMSDHVVNNFKSEIVSAWLVIDNRESQIPYEYRKDMALSFNSSQFYSTTKTENHTLRYGLAITKKGGWFGANYKFAVEHTYENKLEKVNSSELVKTVSVNYPVSVTVPPDTLYFRKLRVLGSATSAKSFTLNGDTIDIFEQDSIEKVLLSTDDGIVARTFSKYENVPEIFQKVYSYILNTAFEKISKPEGTTDIKKSA